jgi:ribosome-associated toxin RatA of RatAB toxin-antitoxin module
MMTGISLLLLAPVAAALARAASAGGGPDATAVDVAGVDTKTLAALINQGQLLLVREDERGRLGSITGGILIERPMQDVWNVLIDYNRYAEFMPSTEECRLIADRGADKDVLYKIKFKFLVSFIVEYTMRATLKPPATIEFRLLESKGNKLRRSIGSWQLVALDGGKRTAALYTVSTDFSDVVWGFERLMKKEPAMEVAINAGTCLLVLKALKNRSENSSWRRERD